MSRRPISSDFTIVEKAGPKAMLVFERQSRQPLTKGVPGLYTKDGYYKHFTRRVETRALQLAEEETWVLGAPRSALAVDSRLYRGGPTALPRGLPQNLAGVHQRHHDHRDRDLPKTIEITRALSAPDSRSSP